MHILGIDYGTKKIGLAIAYTDTEITMPLKTIENRGALEQIQKFISEYKINMIVAGRPSSSKTTSNRVTRFVEELSRITHIEAQFVDENLSSTHAKSMLSSLRQEIDVSIKKFGTKDTMSAVLILEQWFSEKKATQ